MKAKSNMRKNQKNRKPTPKPIADLVHVDLPFQIPIDFLRQLGEFSNGGFLLMTIASNGNPQVHAQFDNAILALGFQKFGADYFQKLGKQFEGQLNTFIRETGSEDQNNEFEDGLEG
jgi:hypothetical protein